MIQAEKIHEAFRLYTNGLFPIEIAQRVGIEPEAANGMVAAWVLQERSGVEIVLPPLPAPSVFAPPEQQPAPLNFAPVVTVGKGVGAVVGGAVVFGCALIVGVVGGIVSGLAAMVSSEPEGDEVSEYGSKRKGTERGEIGGGGAQNITHIHNHYYK